MNKQIAEKHRLMGIQKSKKLGIYRNSKLKFNKYNKNLQNAFYEYFHRDNNHMSMKNIADTNHMSRSTLYKKLKKYQPDRYLNQFRTNNHTRSFSDWIGGKARTSILSKLHDYMPNNYDPTKNWFYEPFAGMASLAFSVQPKHLVLNDLNKDVVNTFRCVRNNPKELISRLKSRINNNRRSYFYKVRDSFNQNNGNIIDRTSALLYMVATSFNSFIRYNSRGRLNTSFGLGRCKSISSKVIFNDAIYLRKIDLYLFSMDFAKVFKQIPPKYHDFIYFDPPYARGFKRYGANKFTTDDLIRLKDFCLRVTKKHVFIMISNYDMKLVRDIFRNFHIHSFKNAQAMNSSGKSRKRKFREVIITNY